MAASIGGVAAKPAHAKTFTVINTTASGDGSLDQAITAANAGTGAGTDCNATSGVCTINPSSAYCRSLLVGLC